MFEQFKELLQIKRFLMDGSISIESGGSGFFCGWISILKLPFSSLSGGLWWIMIIFSVQTAFLGLFSVGLFLIDSINRPEVESCMSAM